MKINFKKGLRKEYQALKKWHTWFYVYVTMAISCISIGLLKIDPKIMGFALICCGIFLFIIQNKEDSLDREEKQ